MSGRALGLALLGTIAALVAPLDERALRDCSRLELQPSLTAQAPPEQRYEAWTGASIEGELLDGFSLELDLTWRTRDDYSPQSSSIRLLSLHRVAEGLTLGFGYGFYPTWGASGFADGREEHRVTEQASYRIVEPTTRLRFGFRLRFEQRFRPVASGADVGLRLRPRAEVAIPLEPTLRLSLLVYDELGLPLHDAGPASSRLQSAGLESNRAFVGLRAEVTASLRVEVGYLNRFTRRPEHARGDVVSHVALAAMGFRW